MPITYLPDPPVATTITGSFVGQWANRFVPTRNITVESFQYQRTAGNGIVQQLMLWQVGSSSLLASVNPPGTTPIGVSYHPFTPVTLLAGEAYTVGHYDNAGSQFSGWSSSPPAIPADWGHVGARSGLGNSAPPTAAGAPWEVSCVGLAESGTSGPVPPADPPDTEPDPGTTDPGGSLAYWLHRDSVNPDSAPLLSWSRVQEIVSAGGDITIGDVTTYGLSARTIGAAVKALLGYVVANGQGITSWLSWLTTPNRPAGQDAIDTILNRIDLQTGGGQGNSQWVSGTVLDPARHTQVDSFPFSGQVGWGSGYALHRVHLDTSDDRHPFIDLGAAGFWVPGVGWWAAVLPDGSLTNRTPLEFADQWLWPVPQAATGVVIWCHPATSGTIYAYSTV